MLEDGSAACPALLDLGPLPDGADVIAFTMNDEAALFFVLGHALELPGGVVAYPRTVIRYDEGVFSEEVDLDERWLDGAPQRRAGQRDRLERGCAHHRAPPTATT